MRHPIGLTRRQWLDINEPLYVSERTLEPDEEPVCPGCNGTGTVTDYYDGEYYDRTCLMCEGEGAMK